MGKLLVFAAGYVMGARAGEESFDDVVAAVRAIRKTDEFEGLLKALQLHAASSLRGLADLVERLGTTPGTGAPGLTPSDLLERVRTLAGRR